MNDDFFENLFEIQSLQNMISTHLDNIGENNKRVTFIDQRILEKNQSIDRGNSRLSTIKEDLNSFERKLFDIESRLEKIEENYSLATSEVQIKAFDKEKLELAPRQDQVQEDILKRMEEEETIISNIDSSKDFILGATDSKSEILEEVVEGNKAEQLEIDRYTIRINFLKEATDKTFLDAFEYAKGKVCKISQNSCSVCRFTLDQFTVDQITKFKKPENCPGCTRLLAP